MTVHRVANTILPAVLAIVLLTGTAPLSAQEAPIRVYRDNPCYWEYRGGPMLLLGGSDEDNLFNHPALATKTMDTLAGIGGNYLRCTLSSRDDGNLWPYIRLNEGQYDLTQFDPAYWERLDTFIRDAGARGIVVQVEIWSTLDFYRDNWLKNPFNPDRNANYTVENTTLEYKWEYHPAQQTQPFFLTVPELNDDDRVRGFQESFVRKVLDVAGKYPNVIFSIDSETRAPREWALWWASFIRREGERRGRSWQVTETWEQYDISASEHEATYSNPDLFPFLDISANNWMEGQVQYDRLLWFRQKLLSVPGGVRPMNSVRVHDRRGQGRSGGDEMALGRWWRNIFAGAAAVRFDRTDGGIGLDETAQATIKATRTFASVFGVFGSEPRADLLSGRDTDEAYCLALPGTAYAVMFPTGGAVILETTLVSGNIRVRWLDTEKSTFTELTNRDTVRAVVQGPNPGRTYLQLGTPKEKGVWVAIVEKK
jgi:hypothetical protein